MRALNLSLSLLLGLTLSVAALRSEPAEATVMVRLTPEQLVDASDYIVRGTVSATWVDADATGRHWTHVQLEVTEVVKGPADLDALEIQVMGGAIGTRLQATDGSPRFDEDEDVLVFAEVLSSGLVVPTGMRQGKFSVLVDPDDGRPILVDFVPPWTLAYDHRFIPVPPAGERLRYDAYTARLRARVARGWDGQPIPGKSLDRLRVMHPASAHEVAP